MLKTALKQAIGLVATVPPGIFATRRRLRSRICIVYGHYFGDPKPFVAERPDELTLDRLADTLELLSTFFRFAPLEEVIADESAGMERPSLAVTFDDGFDLIRSGAADVLDAFGVRATSFLVTGCLGNRDLMWRSKLIAMKTYVGEDVVRDRHAELVREFGLAGIPDEGDVLHTTKHWPMERKEELVNVLWERCGMPPLADYLDEHRPYFTDDGVQDWLARGHSIGLHTRSHPVCQFLEEDGVEREIVAPAAELRERYGVGEVPFSYPFGSRLALALEQTLVERGIVSCALGIEGFAARGSAPHRLERACIDEQPKYAVLGKTLLG